MAQPARVRPLPDSGHNGPGESDWMHDLTPTVSDETMFLPDGPVQPLQVWPTEPATDRPRPKLRLVRSDESGVEPRSVRRSRSSD